MLMKTREKMLPTPHFSSPEIETRWYSLSSGISPSLKPSSTVSKLFSLNNLKRRETEKRRGENKRKVGRGRTDEEMNNMWIRARAEKYMKEKIIQMLLVS